MKFATTILVLLTPTALVPASVAEAQPLQRAMSPKATQILLEQFDQRLKEADEHLVRGEPEKAYKKVSALLFEMSNRFISGPAVGRFLGLATTLRAIAAYQLGRHDEAIWHWQVATQMFPEVADYKMTAYGEAGPFLKSHLATDRSGLETLSMNGALMAGVKPPKKRRTPQPNFPMAKRHGKNDLAVVVSVIIGKDGRVREPRVKTSEGELTLVCATLDKLRLWEFEPAESGGEAIEVFYNLTVNFKPQG